MCFCTNFLFLQALDELVPDMVRGGRDHKVLIETKAAVALDTLPQLKFVEQLQKFY